MKNVKFQCFQRGFADSSCMENSLKDMHAIKGSISPSWGEQGRQWGMWPLLGPAGVCSWALGGHQTIERSGAKEGEKEKENTEASEKMNQVYRRKSRSSRVTLSLPTPPPF